MNFRINFKTLSSEKRSYILQNLLRTLVDANDLERATLLLKDIAFLEIKITEYAVNELLKDYLLNESFETDPILSLISQSISQHAGSLDRCKTYSETFGTLLGCLLPNKQLEQVIAKGMINYPTPFLKPLYLFAEQSFPMLIRTFTGETDRYLSGPAVCAVALLSNRAVVSCMNGMVRVWDLKTCEELLTIYGDNWKPDGIGWPWPNCSIDPYGTMICFISGWGYIDVWDVRKMSKVFTYKAIENEKLHSCLMSPSGKYVVIIGTLNKVLSIDGVEELLCFPGREKNDLSHYQIAVSPINDVIAVIPENDQIIELWDIPSQILLFTFAGHKDSINHITFDATGGWLVSVSLDRSIRIWDTNMGRLVLPVESGYVPDFCEISPDNKYILVYSTSYDTATKNKYRWDIVNLEKRTFSEIKDRLDSASIAVTNQYIYGGINDQIAIVDNETGKFKYSIKALNNVSDIKTTQKQNTVVTASYGGDLHLWKFSEALVNTKLQGAHKIEGHIVGNKVILLNTGQQDEATKKTLYHWGAMLLENKIQQIGMILAASPSNRYFVLYEFATKRVLAIDAEHNEAFLLINEEKWPSGFYGETFTVSGDDRYIAFIQNGLSVFSIHEKRSFVLLSKDKAVSSCVFNESGRFLVAGCYDKSIQVWDTSNWQMVQKIQDPSDKKVGASMFFRRLIVSPVDPIVLTTSYSGLGINEAGYEDSIFKAWSLKTGDEIYRLEGHKAWAGGGCFSPDGKYIVTTAFDRTVKIWNAEDGVCLTGICRNNGKGGDACVFHTDSRHIAVGNTYISEQSKKAMSTENYPSLFFYKLSI